MRLLSIDPGSENTGWAYFMGDTLMESGAWNFKKYDSAIMKVGENIEKYIIDHKIEKVVCEDVVSYARHGNASIKLARITGIIFETCRRNKIYLDFLTPFEINSIMGICGRRSERKAEIKSIIEDFYGSEHVKKQDQADAIFLGLAYLNDIDEIQNA